MTVVSLKAENSPEGAVKVELSDGSSLLFSIDYLPEPVAGAESRGFPPGSENPFLWEAGRELSPGEEEAFRFAASCFRAEKAALRLVARAEQNSLGLTAKLERRGFDTAVVRAVISRFEARNLLDDGRFAELWIRSRLALRKAVSPRWLRISLGKRGIDRRSSGSALEKALDPETEYDLLLRYLEKTRLSESEGERKLRAKLKYEGFSPDVLDRHFDGFRES